MAVDNPRLVVAQRNGITHVELYDRSILDQPVIERMTDEIEQLIDKEYDPKFLIDFKNVEHLSSAALGALVRISHRIQDKSGQLRLVNLAQQLWEIFEITRLIALFQIYDDVDKAIGSYR